MSQAPAPSPSPVVPREFLWVLFVTLPVLALIVFPTTTGSMTAAARDLAALAIDTVAIGFALQASSEWVQRRMAKRSRAQRTLAVAIAGAVAGAVASAVVLPLLARLHPTLAGHEAVLAVRGFAIAAIYLTAGCSLARARTRTVAASVLAHAQTRAALEAKLQALQARTNPHFLFNSLASISALVALDPEQACVMLDRMAGLFRYALDSGTRTRATVREEVDAVRDYLAVERMRLGERLAYAIEIDPSILDNETPPMVLQPLVENAIFHGAEARRGGGTVTVRGVRHGAAIVLSVHDDGPGTSQRKGAGTSLQSLRDRLALLYGDAAGVGIVQAEGFRVTVRLPATTLVPSEGRALTVQVRESLQA